MFNLFGKKKTTAENLVRSTKEQPDQDNAKKQEKITTKLKRVNIERYKDPEGLTVKKMEAGLWYIEHRRQLLNIFLGLLAAISILFWAYALYGFGYYFFRGRSEDLRMVEELLQTNIIGHEYLEKLSPKDLIYFTPQVLLSGPGKYDFLVQVRNTNKRHWGEYDYYFMVGDQELEHGHSFIYPEESKYFMSLAHELPSRPTAANFKLENVAWHKINRHVISDWNAYKNERFDFTVDNVQFIPASLSGLSEKVSLNHLEFTATNNSAYSYWTVKFAIILYKRGIIVGVNQYALDEFFSGQIRNVHASWPGQIGRVDNVEVMPYVNIMEEGIYIRPRGGIGEEK